jgi:hypothetical protein
MKVDEALELVNMMAGMTSTRLLEQEHEVWVEQIVPLDAGLATKAVLAGRRDWDRFPSWKSFMEAYNLQKRLAEPVGDQRDQVVVDGKRGFATPEWVYVWWWARRSRAPRVLVAFPQQRGYVDDIEVMSQERYEQLLDEWVKAGSPKQDVAAAVRNAPFNQADIVEKTISVLQETADSPAGGTSS